MKLQVERDVLAEAVTWAVRGLSPRPPVPVLAGVLLEATAEGLTLSAFDYEVSAKVTIDAQVDEPDTVLVHGRLLADDTPAALIARHGQAVINATARTPEAAAALRARTGAAGEGVALRLALSPAQADAFIAAAGPDLAGFHRAEPDLESVFLALTGRSLRDEGALARERGHRAW